MNYAFKRTMIAKVQGEKVERQKRKGKRVNARKKGRKLER